MNGNWTCSRQFSLNNLIGVLVVINGRMDLLLTRCCFIRDLQWTDPRLLKKYSLVKQPYKKSLTIPYVNKSEYGSDVVDGMSDDEAELLYSENKHFLFKCKFISTVMHKNDYLLHVRCRSLLFLYRFSVFYWIHVWYNADYGCFVENSR
jgi:hypothetical protein